MEEERHVLAWQEGDGEKRSGPVWALKEGESARLLDRRKVGCETNRTVKDAKALGLSTCKDGALRQ